MDSEPIREFDKGDLLCPTLTGVLGPVINPAKFHRENGDGAPTSRAPSRGSDETGLGERPPGTGPRGSPGAARPVPSRSLDPRPFRRE